MHIKVKINGRSVLLNTVGDRFCLGVLKADIKAVFRVGHITHAVVCNRALARSARIPDRLGSVVNTGLSRLSHTVYVPGNDNGALLSAEVVVPYVNDLFKRTVDGVLIVRPEDKVALQVVSCGHEEDFLIGGLVLFLKSRRFEDRTVAAGLHDVLCAPIEVGADRLFAVVEIGNGNDIAAIDHRRNDGYVGVGTCSGRIGVDNVHNHVGVVTATVNGRTIVVDRKVDGNTEIAVIGKRVRREKIFLEICIAADFNHRIGQIFFAGVGSNGNHRNGCRKRQHEKNRKENA